MSRSYRTETNESLLARFMAFVQVNEQGCWIWQGCKNDFGHGYFGMGGKSVKAHRAAWMLLRGEIPRGEGHHGICVCHDCPGGDNPSCVNPDHLFLGTTGDNTRDAIKKGTFNHIEKCKLASVLARLSKTHCKHGHLFDESNTKITRRGVRQCRACLKARNDAKPKTGPPKPATHCKKGHQFTTENTYTKPNGNRACMCCKRIRQREKRARLRESRNVA